VAAVVAVSSVDTIRHSKKLDIRVRMPIGIHVLSVCPLLAARISVLPR
jgi:hypothetical protein